MIGTPASLAGQHAVVTGGGSGIGAAIAASLAGNAMRLTLVGRNRARLEQHAEVLRHITEVNCEAADLSDPVAVQSAFDGAAQRCPVTVLVNNAGQAMSAPLARTEPDDWQRLLSVDLTAPYLCMRAALPGMLAAGWGRIVTIASTAGLKGYAYASAYCAAKHGVIGLTRAVALELAHTGVTVNAVCPGFTDTEIVTRSIADIQARTGRDAEAARQELARFNPQNRLVQPEEVAAVVLWLCQPGSASVTGQSISVSGGEVM
jgi:NAD(P)-dependent dehydrogenase (short-subunit alcohol dehydrogenase family)